MSLDEKVRELLQAGDASGAATAVIKDLGPSVLRYLRSMLRDEEDAADAFSQFAENVWKGLPGFRGGSSLKTWSFRVAWNAALNLRNEAWRRRARPFSTGEASALAETIRTKTAVRVQRQHDALDKLREALTADEQTLLALRIDQGFSWAEIAEVMAESGRTLDPNTLMKRFERLKTRLAEMAKGQGLVE